MPFDLTPISLAILVVAGIASGFTAGLLGVGGGIISVPIIFWYLSSQFSDSSSLIHFAIGTSLSIIILTSISSSLTHFRLGNLDGKIFKKWWWLMMLGALLGGFSAHYYNSVILGILFALFSLFVAFKLLLPPNENGLAKNSVVHGITTSFLNSPLLPGTIGYVSALFGIGGGTLSVPAMVAKGLEMKRAIGTSATLGLMIAVPATLGFIISGPVESETLPATIGYIYLPAFIFLAPISIICAPIGAKFTTIIDTNWLKRLLALIILISAIRLMIKLFQG